LVQPVIKMKKKGDPNQAAKVPAKNARARTKEQDKTKDELGGKNGPGRPAKKGKPVRSPILGEGVCLGAMRWKEKATGKASKASLKKNN